MTLRKKIIILLFVSGFFVVSFISHMNMQKDVSPCGLYHDTPVFLGEISFSVQIADTDCKRMLGLSGRTILSSTSGMLFLFPQEGSHTFWMKDMHFPIDIVWLSSDMTIVGIEKSVSPDSYPTHFGGQYQSQAVLELPAGTAERQELILGTHIQIDSSLFQK